MNVKGITRIAGLYTVVWLGFMLVPWLTGHPEVICATPFGLVLALAAGTGTLPSTKPSARLTPWAWMDAVLAGAIVGGLQGLLLSLVLPFMMAQQEGNQARDQLLVLLPWLLASPVAGCLLGAVLGIVGYGFRAIGRAWRQQS